MMSDFAKILAAMAKALLLEFRLGTRLVPIFLRSNVLSCSSTHETIHVKGFFRWISSTTLLVINGTSNLSFPRMYLMQCDDNIFDPTRRMSL